MIPENEAPVTEEVEFDALLAFDQALAAGADPLGGDLTDPFLHPVHECQRLLEAVWPHEGVSTSRSNSRETSGVFRSCTSSAAVGSGLSSSPRTER